jgi:diacylglycerol kinase (ATP)
VARGIYSPQLGGIEGGWQGGNPMQRLIHSFRYAFAGIGYLFRTQPNARIQLGITLVVVGAGLWVGLPARDWAVIALAVGLVFTAEAFNTALEAVVDLASPEQQELARVAKDVGAAAVTLAALAAVVVGVLVLGPRILDF